MTRPITKIEELRETALNAGQNLLNEAQRRAELARQPRPAGVSGPPLHLLLGELASIKDMAKPAPPPPTATHPQPVMLIPGFGAHPLRMRKLLRSLAAAGHQAHNWGRGFNLGATPQIFDSLMSRVDELAQRHGQPVALVGWSLGGIFAREIARQNPVAVSKVITMGTPFSGDMHANNAWRAYEFVTGYAVDAPPIPYGFGEKPPVPTIAIWSPKDGVVSPRSARGKPHERDAAVSVRCTHLTFGSDPAAIAEVLRQLDH